MFDFDQVFGDGPQVVLRSHPAHRVEASQVHRAGVSAERLLPIQVVIVLEVRDDELAEVPVDGRAEA